MNQRPSQRENIATQFIGTRWFHSDQAPLPDVVRGKVAIDHSPTHTRRSRLPVNAATADQTTDRELKPTEGMARRAETAPRSRSVLSGRAAARPSMRRAGYQRLDPTPV